MNGDGHPGIDRSSPPSLPFVIERPTAARDRNNGGRDGDNGRTALPEQEEGLGADSAGQAG